MSQSIIKGSVADSAGKKLPGVILMAKSPEGKILGFGTSNMEGLFSISLSTAVPDSSLLEASFLGFQKQYFNLKPNTNYKVTMLKDPDSLKEVIVTSVRRRESDSLDFDPDKYAGLGDRTVGDILAKLPGIEIDPSGRIKYQGKEIVNYYINGLNMLDGRYKLANDNIPIDALKKIQIIENDQPVKILKKVSPSDRASINIQLKGFTIATNVKAGIGAGRHPLRDVSVTPMFFFKNFQSILTYQSNNTGVNPNTYMQDFQFQDNVYSRNFTWLQGIQNPPVKENSWLNNNTNLFTGNFLQKLSTNAVVKANGYYLNDHQTQRQENSSTYFVNSDHVSVVELMHNSYNQSNAGGALKLEVNSPKVYLTENLMFKAHQANDLGLVDRTDLNSNTNQRNTRQLHFLRNQFNYSLPVGKQVIGIESNITYKNSPELLSIRSGVYPEILNDSVTYPLTKQQSRLKVFNTNNQANWNTKMGYYGDLKASLGMEYDRQQLVTNLSADGDGTLFDLDYYFNSALFHNDLQLTDRHAYLSTAYNYQNPELFNLYLTLPIEHRDIGIHNYMQNSADSSIGKWLVYPNVNINRRFFHYYTLTWNSGWGYNYGNIDNLNTAYILSSYRSINNQTSGLQFNDFVNHQVSLDFENPLPLVSSSLTLGKNVSHNSNTYASYMDTTGNSSGGNVRRRNTFTAYNMGFRFSKIFPKIKTSLRMELKWNQNNSVQILNNVNNKVVNTCETGTFTVSNKRWAFMNAEYVLSLYRGTGKTNGARLSRTYLETHSLNVDFFPSKQQQISIDGSYRNSHLAMTSRQVYLNLVYEYQLRKSKVDLSLEWDNIFNHQYFTSAYIDAYSEVINRIDLRPMQGVFRIGFHF
ncbi:MAG: hypothetical protein DI598_12110 [Pseudopedobacter saltans]|uniref:TonB-dependent receptor n=1 Tax=Pseudopedobacter saltans TaxID=151895 RepID=A0A2W5EVD0_9SPHI|nr:MAG: hypothetical protein DI598_12110 [Pseudopedobacter saltans]